MPRHYVDTLILEVIEKGLDSLGNSPKRAIWVFLETDFNVKRNDLPGNIREFHEGLQKIFGLGYKFLDKLFCHYLQEATKKRFDENQCFADCVESLLESENNSK
ncbi:MAG: hypothetical protein NWF06_01500 [Candidatus Bathyarchaeota archaeon]|nr:hypothetical protein [Candidatus Bathyarchaeum sp.]